MKNLFANAAFVAAALLFGANANAVTCSADLGQPNNPKIVSATVDNASACEGVLAGNDPFPNDLNAFGGTWTALDKDGDGNGDLLDGALTITFDSAERLSGTWTIDPTIAGYPGTYNQFVLALKPDGGVAYFLLNALSGTFSVNFGLSHGTLYGRRGDVPCCEEEVPEPGTLALLGLGLVGLGMTRRRFAK